MTEQRHHNPASVATGTGVGTHGFGYSGIGLGVGDIDRRSITHGLGVGPVRLVRLWEGRPRGSVASVVGARERGELDLIAPDPGHNARVPPQQADGATQDRVEHRLDIRLRLADGAQDVAGGGLRVQRRGQLAVALLELLEQAYVLDRDDGLVGKGLEQRDLPLGEELSLGAPDADRADRNAFSHQGNAERRAETQLPRGLAALGKLVRRTLHVGNLDCPPIKHRSASDRAADEREGKLADGANGNGAVMGDQEEPVVVPAEDGGVQRLAQAGGALRNGVEHGLNVGRRAADDL